MANMQELANVEAGASNEELANEQVASESGVANAETEQVADEAQEQEVPESISYEDFRKLQSKLDKRIAELQKENEQLKQKIAPIQKGPTPEEESRYNELYQRYLYYQQAVENAESDEEKLAAVYAMGSIQKDLMDAEATIIAREVGIDPNHPRYREALATEDIQSAKDIERIAWMVRAETAGSNIVSQTIAEREAKLKEAEASFEQRVRDAVQQEIAKLRQELGLNAVPGVQSAGPPAPRTQLERQLEEAKKMGDWGTVLNIKRQMLTLE